MKKLNIVVIGTGMYSTGRGTNGYGTILPAIVEWKRSGGEVGSIHFVGTKGMHSNEARKKIDEISLQTGVPLDVTIMPENGESDTEAYKKIINNISKPACAIVVVPDHLHYNVTRDCLDAGMHVLVVKPLTPTVNDGLKLVKLAKENDLYGAVEFHKRFDRANLMIRDTIMSGRIGVPLYSWVEYSQRKSIPTEIFKAWVEESNILQYLGVHYIDIMRFITMATPIRVMATGQMNWLNKQGLNTYDSIQCVIEWQLPTKEKFIQTILTNWVDPETSSAMSDQKIKIVGENGRIESDQKERGIRINVDDSHIEQPNPDFCMRYGVDKGLSEWRGYGIESVSTFFSEVSDIVNKNRAINDVRNRSCSFEEALISTSILEAADYSLTNNNAWCDVDRFINE